MTNLYGPDVALPPVIVVLQTYKRTEYALRTVKAALNHLQYAALYYYIADDGSDPVHFDAVYNMLNNGSAIVIGSHRERLGYGASANKAWHACHDQADITLWLEDDWELSKTLDITPYVQLLQTAGDIGMVRIAGLPVGLHCTTIGYEGRHYLRLWNETQYMFSGNPALRHRRAREAWGPYPEGLNPGDTEVAYDSQVRERGGASIVWPVDLGGYGVFAHIGENKSYA